VFLAKNKLKELHSVALIISSLFLLYDNFATRGLQILQGLIDSADILPLRLVPCII